MERRGSFTPMVYSANGIPVTEAVAAHKHLASLLINKLNQEYLEMCGSVTSQMLLTIVRSSTHLLLCAGDNEALIQKRPNLEDGAVMELMVPWWG